MEGVFSGISNAKANVQQGQELIGGFSKEAAGVANEFSYSIQTPEIFEPRDNTNVVINIAPPSDLPQFENNTEAVFGDRLHEIIDRDVPDFVGSGELNSLLEEMQTIDEKTQEEQMAFLEKLAVEMHGEEYSPDQFEHLKEQLANFNAYKDMLINDTEVGYDHINEEKFPDFLGTLEHYKFGEMVGESIGMDPLFASMLSPTGGLVGPGNGIDVGGLFTIDSGNLSIDNPIGVHGIVHDAAGFLFNGFNIGPGYSYKGSLFPTDWPIAGQVSGVAYWTWDTITDTVGAAWDTATDFISDSWETVQQTASDAWDSATDSLESAWDYAQDTVSNTVDQATDFANDTMDQIESGIDQMQNSITDAYNSTTDYLNDTWDSVQDTANEAKESAQDFLQDTWEFVSGF